MADDDRLLVPLVDVLPDAGGGDDRPVPARRPARRRSGRRRSPCNRRRSRTAPGTCGRRPRRRARRSASRRRRPRRETRRGPVAVAVDREHVVVLQVTEALAEGQLLRRRPRAAAVGRARREDGARLALARAPRGAAQDRGAVVEEADGRVAGAVVEERVAAVGRDSTQPARRPRPAAVEQVAEPTRLARAVVVPRRDQVPRIRRIDRDVDLVVAVRVRAVVRENVGQRDAFVGAAACRDRRDRDQPPRNSTEPAAKDVSSSPPLSRPRSPRAPAAATIRPACSMPGSVPAWTT